MFSAVHSSFRSHLPKEIPKPTFTPCKVTVLVLELLLLVGGAGVYFSGLGVVPASILWGACLSIEVASFFSTWSEIKNDAAEPVQKQTSPHIEQAEMRTDEPLAHRELSLNAGQKSQFQELMNALEEMKLVNDSSGQNPRSLTRLLNSLLQKRIFVLKENGVPGITIQATRYREPGFKNTPEYSNLWIPKKAHSKSWDASRITDWLYVATSPKTREEVPHFLWLLYESEQPIVVMTTDDITEDPLQTEPASGCYRYWPTERDWTYPGQFDNFGWGLQARNAPGSATNFRHFAISQRDGNQHPIHQFFIQNWSHAEVFNQPKVIHQYTSSTLKRMGAGEEKSVIVHDESSKGSAAVFALSLLLHAFHNAAKEKSIHLEVDLDQFIDFFRYDADFGRDGIIDLSCHRETLRIFAEELKNL